MLHHHRFPQPHLQGQARTGRIEAIGSKWSETVHFLELLEVHVVKLVSPRIGVARPDLLVLDSIASENFGHERFSLASPRPKCAESDAGVGKTLLGRSMRQPG